MSIDIVQLDTMATSAERLAGELRELIALRERLGIAPPFLSRDHGLMVQYLEHAYKGGLRSRGPGWIKSRSTA